jgi:hypothetical protein
MTIVNSFLEEIKIEKPKSGDAGKEDEDEDHLLMAIK